MKKKTTRVIICKPDLRAIRAMNAEANWIARWLELRVACVKNASVKAGFRSAIAAIRRGDHRIAKSYPVGTFKDANR